MTADGPRRIDVEYAARASCLVMPPAAPRAGVRPPLLVAFHGHGQDGARHARWTAAPPEFAAAFPDGPHKHEVRRPDRAPRVGCAWYLFDGDRGRLAEAFVDAGALAWRMVDAAVAALDADPSRVWLAGFSQGAYLVHVLAQTHPERVAGWIGQAGGFRPEYLGTLPPPALEGRRVLLQHGESDLSLPVERTHVLARDLSARGADVTVRTYDAGHVITPDMTRDAHDWLASQPRSG